MVSKLRKYEKFASYLYGFGFATLLGGVSIVDISRLAWLQISIAIAVMLIGGVYGSLAKREEAKG